MVTWVAPNGPAWSADIRPKDHIVDWDGTGRRPPTLTARFGAQLRLLGAAPTSPPLLSLLMAALGLAFLGSGVLALGRSPGRPSD